MSETKHLKNMEWTLLNPNGSYCLYELGKEVRCYVAIDNAHGGATLTCRILGKAEIDKSANCYDGYRIAYVSPESPYEEIEAVVHAEHVFTSLETVAEARKNDVSMQVRHVSMSCKTSQGLVRFLLSRANLAPYELDAVVAEAKILGLYCGP